MVYVALLRGINVGGRHKVEMPRLKAVFEGLDLANVETYINTGNVVFETDAPVDVPAIEAAIETTFGFPVPTLVRSHAELSSVVEALPDSWVTDKVVKTNVMFLFDTIDGPEIVAAMGSRDGIDTLRYVPGALLWHLNRADQGKSAITKIPKKTYGQMTVRNANTTRKVFALLEARVQRR